ncbi:MAG: hypothetical protein H6Q37_1478 [Chloroflexi bacterium]|jgi:hypothetical protein|nr:hypothetical protein [Chloroflexota bacterium]
MALGGLVIGLYFKLGGIRSAFQAAGAFAVLEDIRQELDRSELTELIGRDAFFETGYDVEAAFRTTNAIQ